MKITKKHLKQIIREEVDNANLEKFLVQKRANLNGWKLEVESMSGSWAWENPKYPDCTIYATLGWEGEETIPIQVNDEDDNIVYTKTLKYKPTGNVVTDSKVYLKTLKTYINKIESILKK
tara:strand:- start:404 stop:763 length:360 start_codon:yes stop_codon:yes gene_type:complete